ncbi:MAG: hypothetical protein MJ145_04785 [Clostridia bacterium]|nr:hypothetical protein [Clostridia bacterium]
MKTVGFPMIRNFSGDIRDFIPALFEFMDRYDDVEFFLEDGYGERLGYTKEDYYKASSKVHFVSREESFGKDITMILKNPEPEDLEMLKDGSVYFSMLHYATRPQVREIIERKHLKALAMDHVVDDDHKRIFVDFFGTSFNACKEGVETLKKVYKDFYSPERGPIKAIVIGVGGVGQNAIKSLEVLSDKEFLGTDVAGILPIVCNRSITGNPKIFNELLKDAQLLIDATQRRDESVFVVTNDQVGLLPEDAVIIDISADRYDFGVNPPLVKGVEGTLTGSPDHFVIEKDDPRYETEFPHDVVKADNRRVTVSCNAWPGVDVPRSVDVYFGLMKNYVGIIFTKEFEDISEDSDNLFERGLARSKYEYYLAHK